MEISNVETDGAGDADGAIGDDDYEQALGNLQQQINALQSRYNSSRGNGAGGGNKVPGRTPAEIEKFRQEGRCFLCGDKGHMKRECSKAKKSQSN